MRRKVLNLTRLFKPKTIAVIGGGEWCKSIMSAAHQIGYEGTILPIHPSGKEIAGIKSLKSLIKLLLIVLLIQL